MTKRMPLAAIITLGIGIGTVEAQPFDYVQSYDQTRTAIFGSGNPNTGWTIGSNDSLGIEVGLRAKNRSNGSTLNANGVYQFASAPASRGLWNYEFTMNSDVANSVVPLSAYDWYLAVDADPSQGVLPIFVQPLFQWGDNSYGNNSTATGQGVEPGNLNDYLTFPDAFNIAQNSENITFGDYPGGALPLDQNATYTFELFAVNKNASPNSRRLVSTSITVVVGNGGAAVPPVAHGKYVSAAVKFVNELVSEGKITQEQASETIAAVASSGGN